MKEDVLKFRNLCDILIREKGMNVNKISIESGINWPTLKKLREEDISSIHLQASVLGQVQNYLHKRRDDINYAGVSSGFVEKSEKQLAAEFQKSQVEVILAGKRKEEFDNENIQQEKVLPGKDIHERHEELLKDKNGGPLPVEEARKYIRKDKGNVSGVIGDTTSDKTKEVIGPRNLVEIIIFLRMESKRHRKIAHDFDVSASQLEKVNL